MNDEPKRLAFQLLQGGSEPSAPSRNVELAVLPRRDIPPVQLGFPFVRVSNKLLVSVGYDGLTQAALEKLLSEYMPTSLVDIRISPSFNNHVLARDAVAKALKAYRVKYYHLPELANRFVGDSLDARWSLEKYAASLIGHSQLAVIHELIEQGPLLLLGRTSQYVASERAILIDELKRRWPSFEVIVHF
jgi:uncharacterized protein (DUF488 family)